MVYECMVLLYATKSGTAVYCCIVLILCLHSMGCSLGRERERERERERDGRGDGRGRESVCVCVLYEHRVPIVESLKIV